MHFYNFCLCASIFSLLPGIFTTARAAGTGLTAAGVPLLIPKFYAITGSKTGRNEQTGFRVSRRNILDLQKDPIAWSLYIQALIAMQSANETDPLSYFQIAGIHGRPFIPWNNFNRAPTAPETGYCTHNSILFATWHRPYLALFEQLLVNHAQVIAKTYPHPLEYQNAANNLRIPFWDWGTTPVVPITVSQEKIDITTPDGIKSVDNPLYSYRFHAPLDPAYFPPSALTAPQRTFRGGSNDLTNLNLRSGTWDALVKTDTFNAFSTIATSGSSVESVHNQVHAGIGGGNGYMTWLEYSAFDPIFWLHHANVDRLFALWQAIHPNEYLSTPASEPGTFTLPSRSMDNVATPLGPFTSNKLGTAYDSASVRSTKVFGYTYPELEDWHQNANELKGNVTAQLYTLYNPGNQFQKATRALSRRTKLVPGSKTRDWYVDLSVCKADLGGEGFNVRLFLGVVPENPKDWSSCLGTLSVMPSMRGSDMPMTGLTVYNEVNLTPGLLEKGHVDDDVDSVSKYLKDSLQWRVQKFDGTVVPTEKVPSLRVVVHDQTVTLARKITELPVYGEKTEHADITKGKVGGYAKI